MSSRVYCHAILGSILAGLIAALAPAASGPVFGQTTASPGGRIISGHAIAMHGDVKYGADFRNFDYVVPRAAKGGDVKLAAIGGFDTFNPFILRGNAAAGIGSLFDTLTIGSADEPFTRYCLVCETMEVPEDRSWVSFTLRTEARFHDGTPITVEDVIWTFEALKSRGHPFYRAYYASVEKAEKIAERQVRFTFAGGPNRELPLIVGELPVLSRAYWQGRDFGTTTLDPPLGSGPYRIEAFEANRFIVYRRVQNYWANDLPVRVGQNNFDVIRYDYYRDTTIALEAFKAGEYDIRQENSAKNWATAFDSPAHQQGLYKKEELPEQRVTGMQGFVFNTRRAIFQNRLTRAAFGYAFDFEWSNRTLFYGAYTHTRSYFDNSELAARGLPSPEELKILEPFRDKVPAEVFSREYQPPKTDGTGNWRENQREALRLLREAGWTLKDLKLVGSNGQQMRLEILLSDPQFERIVLPYADNLKRLGIDVVIRTVDTAQYERRLDDFDYDITVGSFGQSESPGNEQRDFWTSSAAETRGSRNLAGIRDPAVDALVDLIINAPDRQSLVMRTRALDRVLQGGYYVVPNWHITADRVAYWDRFGRPQIVPKVGFLLSSWWVDPAKDAALRTKRGK